LQGPYNYVNFVIIVASTAFANSVEKAQGVARSNIVADRLSGQHYLLRVARVNMQKELSELT
jgi:hypothetical protein